MIREAHLAGISRDFTDCWIIKILVCSHQPIVFLHQWRHIQKPSVASSTSSRYPQEHRIQMVCFTHHFVGFLAGTNSGPAWFMLTPSWWVWNHLLGMEQNIESAVDGRNWSGFGWFYTKMMIDHQRNTHNGSNFRICGCVDGQNDDLVGTQQPQPR